MMYELVGISTPGKPKQRAWMEMSHVEDPVLESSAFLHPELQPRKPRENLPSQESHTAGGDFSFFNILKTKVICQTQVLHDFKG